MGLGHRAFDTWVEHGVRIGDYMICYRSTERQEVQR
jgi:hypothetical protein